MTEPLSRPPPSLPEVAETPLDRLLFVPAKRLVAQVCLATPVGPDALVVTGALLGVAGASLYRFTSSANLLMGSLLLLVATVLVGAAGLLGRARGLAARHDRAAAGAAHLLIGVVLLAALLVHLHAQGQAMWLAAAGLGSLLLQGFFLDLCEARFLVRAGWVVEGGGAPEIAPGGLTALFQKLDLGRRAAERPVLSLFPPPLDPTDHPDASSRYALDLAPVLRAWGYLGLTTHAALLAVFAVGHALPAYLWLRLTAGNALLAVLLVVTIRRERAIDAALRPPAGTSGLR
ncbi:MAG: hypothetical protein U0359_08275 [Byssovorax sp.]